MGVAESPELSYGDVQSKQELATAFHGLPSRPAGRSWSDDHHECACFLPTTAHILTIRTESPHNEINVGLETRSRSGAPLVHSLNAPLRSHQYGCERICLNCRGMVPLYWTARMSWGLMKMVGANEMP